ncbi:hypothetical protein BDN70DRAFT_940112 [Pholiota conissans]|uniref:Uncharacterized protein n=1 Tax=Pholiota conissans TaxID=109636 RepID=A0A9P5YJT8_9AGAR|nr:hypothetical protein BDN70DRAFT_940112 [Pholiota conissans]
MFRSTKRAGSTQERRDVKPKKQCVDLPKAYWESLKKHLARLSQDCVACHVLGAEPDVHSINECGALRSLVNAPLGHKAYFDFRKSIRYNPGQKICYLCHIPQGPKDFMHTTFKSNKSSCIYPDVLGPLAFSIFHTPSYKQAAEKSFSTTWDDINQFSEWINGDVHGLHPSNMVAIFTWYAQRTSQKIGTDGEW